MFKIIFPHIIIGCEWGEKFEFEPDASYLAQEGSWETMSLTEEPSKMVLVQLHLHTNIDLEDDDKARAFLRSYMRGLLLTRESGVMLGDVYHALRRISDKCIEHKEAHPEKMDPYGPSSSNGLRFVLRILKKKREGDQ